MKLTLHRLQQLLTPLPLQLNVLVILQTPLPQKKLQILQYGSICRINYSPFHWRRDSVTDAFTTASSFASSDTTASHETTAASADSKSSADDFDLHTTDCHITDAPLFKMKLALHIWASEGVPCVESILYLPHSHI